MIEFMDKNILRREAINKRNELYLEIKSKYDNLILKKVIDSDIYKNSESIFIYVSFGSEVDTKEIINYALMDNKKIYVPKTDKSKKEMKAIRIHSLDKMIVDKWGILEPIDVDKNKFGEKFDLIIMPGVVFDRSGNRIGYGGGYYDKYISAIKCKSVKLALAYDFQVINKIESEEHDINVDCIITNDKFIYIK